MSTGSELMRDAYAKLSWAEAHLAKLMACGEKFLKPRGGDERPFGIQFDNSHPPLVVATFIAEEPLPIEISMHAADCVHNARTALDHVLARLKDHFGGNPRRGTFPVTESDADWKGRVTPRAADGGRRKGDLDGLPCSARLLIYREQPHVAYAGRRHEDPLAILSGLDNDDKHRLLHHGFAYPATKNGLDLIQVRNAKLVVWMENAWTNGDQLEHGTVVARYRLRGNASGLLRVDPNIQIKLSTGPLDGPRTTYEDMINRTRGIVDRAVALIDAAT